MAKDKAYWKKYYEEHRSVRLAVAKRDYWENREKRLAQNKAQYIKHREKRLKYQKERSVANREANKKRNHDWYEQNRKRLGFNKKGSKKHRVKMKEMGDARRGILNWNWKGGTRREQHYGERRYGKWRTKVFTRDSYTCQLCRKGGGIYIEAHHKKSWKNFPVSRYVVSNGVTLCRACHVVANREQRAREKTYDRTA